MGTDSEDAVPIAAVHSATRIAVPNPGQSPPRLHPSMAHCTVDIPHLQTNPTFYNIARTHAASCKPVTISLVAQHGNTEDVGGY
ncbi:MAG: hypothetical protein WCA98_15430 [Candidatus Acidiferrales bacterium]